MVAWAGTDAASEAAAGDDVGMVTGRSWRVSWEVCGGWVRWMLRLVKLVRGLHVCSVVMGRGDREAVSSHVGNG